MTQLNYHYFRFFFTHLAQEVTEAGLTNWVELVQESLYDELPLDGLGQVFIKISPSLKGDFNNTSQVSWASALQSGNSNPPVISNQGELELKINNGKTTLDASYTINVSSGLRLDSILQPVQNYKLLWDTPIFEGQVRNHADFIWTEDVDVSRLYPYVVGPQYIYKPWHFAVDVEKEDLLETQPVWQNLTIDNVSVLVSQTELSNAYGSLVPLTTDRTEQFSNQIVNKKDLELTGQDLPDPLIRLENVPQGDIYLTLKIANLIKSKTWRGWGGRGYTPASRISDSMQNASLTETAWSIFTLIAFEDDYLLLLVLAEISYIWANYLENVTYEDGQVTLNPLAIAGFPTYIPRILEQYPHSCYIPNERSIKENAWLGLALVQAAKFLSNRKQPLNLPPFFNQLLSQLGKLISGSIDAVTGWAIAGYDEQGYALEQVDYRASLISNLFLTELLSVQYEEQAHFSAAASYLAIKDITDFKQLPAIEQYDNNHLIDLHLYYLIWLDRFNKTDIIKPIAESYRLLQLVTQRNAENIAISLFIINKLYKAGRLDANFPISTWNPDLATKKFDLGLYGISTASPELITSSAVILTKEDWDIFTEQDSFQLNADEAFAYASYANQTARRLWPYGYQWLSPEAEEPTGGELGALLHAYSFQVFNNQLLISLLRQGGKISTAQGKVLDTIAEGLLRPRRGLQSDSYIKVGLLEVLNNDRSTADAIKDWIKFFYTDNFELHEPSITLSFYIKQGEDYILVNPTTAAAAVEFIKLAELDRADRTPGFYKKQGTSYVFVSWYEFAAQLHIYIYEYLPGFEQDMLSLRSAGIQLSTHLKLMWISRADSFIHDANSYL